MKKILALLILTVLLPADIAAADPTEDIRTAAGYVKSGDKKAAIPLLEGILADGTAPPLAKAQAQYIFSLIEGADDPAAAVLRLDKAIAADPSFIQGYIKKTEKLYEAGKFAEAAEAADAALKVQPGNKEMAQYKASAYFSAGDYARAAEAYGGCLKADNRNGKLYLYRGMSYVLSRQPEKALADFSTANRYASQFAAHEQNDLQYYWGMAYLDTNRFDLATGSFKKALGLGPAEERKADLERLIGETADKKAAYEAMAQTRKELERARKNPRGWTEALQKIVENPYVTNELKAQAYHLLSQTGESAEENLAYADKSVELFPESGENILRQGHLRYALQDYNGAIESFDRALALEPGEALHWISRGIANLGLENWSAAEKDFNKALELQPESAVCYLYRARTNIMLGAIDRAREDIQKVPRDMRRNNSFTAPEYAYVLGLLAQHDKQYKEALEFYRQALNMDASGPRGKDLQKRKDQLESLNRWTQKR